MARVDQLEAALAKHEERAAAIEAELVQLAADEASAREDAIRRAPTQRSDAGGAVSAVAKIQRKQTDREKELAGLRLEITAVASVLADERKRTGQEAVREKIATAHDFRLQEIDRVNEMVAKFGEFGDAWFAYAQLMTESDRFAVSVNGSGLLDANPEMRDEWLSAARPFMQPVPLNFPAAFRKLLEASADPDGYGTRVEGGIRTAGHQLPTMIEARPDLNERLSIGDRDVDTTRGDAVPLPQETLVQPATTATGETSVALASEMLGMTA